jgi:2-isopropylmalate synthase
MSDRVIVFDTTLRDGEQAAGVFFSRAAKVEIADLLDAMSVDVIEAGFPASSPGEHASVAAVAAHVKSATVCALARAIPAEVDVTWEAIRCARDPRVHVFLSSSEIHLAHQLRRGADEVVAMARAAVARTSSSRAWTPRAPIPSSWRAWCARRSPRARARSTCPTPSAGPARTR